MPRAAACYRSLQMGTVSGAPKAARGATDTHGPEPTPPAQQAGRRSEDRTQCRYRRRRLGAGARPHRDQGPRCGLGAPRAQPQAPAAGRGRHHRGRRRLRQARPRAGAAARWVERHGELLASSAAPALQLRRTGPGRQHGHADPGARPGGPAGSGPGRARRRGGGASQRRRAGSRGRRRRPARDRRGGRRGGGCRRGRRDRRDRLRLRRQRARLLRLRG